MSLNSPTTSIIFLFSVMLITSGCITDSTKPTKQLSLSATSTQQETDTIPTTDTEPSTLGSYYNSTVALLTDDCGIVGGLWGATEGSFYGVLSGDSIEGLVIGSMVGSGLGLTVGVKDAYDGFKSDTVGCGTS